MHLIISRQEFWLILGMQHRQATIPIYRIHTMRIAIYRGRSCYSYIYIEEEAAIAIAI